MNGDLMRRHADLAVDAREGPRMGRRNLEPVRRDLCTECDDRVCVGAVGQKRHDRQGYSELHSRLIA